MSAESQIELLADYILHECPNEITDGGAGEVAVKIITKYRKAFDDIMHELGVPGEGYPAPVANAYEIAKQMIEKE